LTSDASSASKDLSRRRSHIPVTSQPRTNVLMIPQVTLLANSSVWRRLAMEKRRVLRPAQ
jgi:hypothetical protein